ncbi:MAG: hypothetical protein LBN37_00920 [Bacteroidales bacterium]|jgi:hypothetical protein|nr:hypothetical protein [Bacteroidales bacterium]
MKGILIILALCTTLSVLAQEPDRAGAENPDSLLIAATRKQMTDLVWAGRFDSVMVIQENFERNHPQLNIVASPERLLLYFWSERYDDIFRFLQQTGENAVPVYGDEALWNVLLYKTSGHINDLYDWIDQTALYDDDIQFLRDLLADLTKEDEHATLQATDKTVATYKEAISAPETDNKTTSSEREFGFGLGLEFGTISFSGDINRYLQPKLYGSLNFDLMVNRWDGAFLVQFASAHLKRDIPLKDGDNTYWKKGATADFINVGLALGYSVVKNNWFRLTPYAGLMVNTISPTETAIENDANLKKANIVTFGQCYGVTSQIRIRRFWDMNANMMLTARFQYVPDAYDRSGVRYQGDFWSLMFGLSFCGFFSY